MKFWTKIKKKIKSEFMDLKKSLIYLISFGGGFYFIAEISGINVSLLRSPLKYIFWGVVVLLIIVAFGNILEEIINIFISTLTKYISKIKEVDKIKKEIKRIDDRLACIERMIKNGK